MKGYKKLYPLLHVAILLLRELPAINLPRKKRCNNRRIEKKKKCFSVLPRLAQRERVQEAKAKSMMDNRVKKRQDARETGSILW